MRLVLVFLLALGKDLMCSPVSFTYRAGGVVAGCGLPGGLLLRSGGGGAILVSSSLVCHLLESAHLSSPSIRLPILFQRFKSVLMGIWGGGFCCLTMLWSLMMEDLEDSASILLLLVMDRGFCC